MLNQEHAAAPVGKLPGDEERRLRAWLSLPPEDRAELLAGRIVYKTMAGIEHGDAVIGISEQLGRVRGPPPDGGGWWLSQDVDMYLGGQGLRPDVVGWRIDKHPMPPEKENVGDTHFGVYTQAPDWVCEILSDSTRHRDTEEGAKWRAYHEAGVSHYWIVDLVREQIIVYRREEGGYEPVDVAGWEAIKPLPPFPNVTFTTKRVFLLARLRRQRRQ